jgi:hypothetical protein
MSETKSTESPSIDEVALLLQQILQMYKALGPESMESLTKSYLAPAPTAETATDVAEEMMAQAFKIFDDATDSVLKGFATQQGFDLSQSENYERRLNEGYFRVFYPAIVMYAIWLDREDQKKALANTGNIFASFMLGVAGYQILDSNLDEDKENPEEILLTLSFIQECERLLLKSFGFEQADYELLNHFKQLFLKSEIKEKQSRFKESPYTIDHPENCGYKAVHAYFPFFLLLQKSGKQNQIGDYLQFFYEWGAPLQIMDDLMDLEDDLSNGHYSYPTLGFEDKLHELSPHELSILIKTDKAHIKNLQKTCDELIGKSKAKCATLKADLFGYFVYILEDRLHTYFSQLLQENQPMP